MDGTRESILSGFDCKLRNGRIDQLINDSVIKPVIMSGLADHLKFLVQLPNVHTGFVFGFRFDNRFMDQVSILANQNLLKVFMLNIQNGPPVK